MRSVKRLVLIATLSACGGATASKDGAEIFATTCAQCHGESGKPTEAMVARLGVRDLTSAEFRARLTYELVENQVRYGSKNQLMPALSGALREDQIQSVSRYVFERFRK